jgi:MarR family transcriptional regulator, organic hydroperoxide resistance regulator
MPATDTPGDLVMHLDSKLCFAVHAASRAFDSLYRITLRPTGLTYPQYLVMLLLWEHGELSIKQLGDRLRLDSGTLSPLVKRLEAAGLVVRRRDPADERSVTAYLTEAGLAMRAEVYELSMRTAVATGLNLAEAEGLRAQLSRLTESLDAAVERLTATQRDPA